MVTSNFRKIKLIEILQKNKVMRTKQRNDKKRNIGKKYSMRIENKNNKNEINTK